METPTLLLGFEYLSKAKEIEYTPEIKVEIFAIRYSSRDYFTVFVLMYFLRQEQIKLIRERFGISSKYEISLGRQRGSLLSEYDDKSWKYLINLKGGEPPIINVVAIKYSSMQPIDIVDIVDDSEDELFIPSPRPKPKREPIHSAPFRPHLHPHVSRPPRPNFRQDDDHEDDDYVADRTYTSGSRKDQPNNSSRTDQTKPSKPPKPSSST